MRLLIISNPASPASLYTRAAKVTAPRIQATDEEAEAVLRAMEELGR